MKLQFINIHIFGSRHNYARRAKYLCVLVADSPVYFDPNHVYKKKLHVSVTSKSKINECMYAFLCSPWMGFAGISEATNYAEV